MRNTSHERDGKEDGVYFAKANTERMNQQNKMEPVPVLFLHKSHLDRRKISPTPRLLLYFSLHTVGCSIGQNSRIYSIYGYTVYIYIYGIACPI